ncbi:sugar phosphate isomerase/epimerase [Microbacterium sp. USTB-Y]|uniref:sugar phosphate isomerase/epimerase family protein n=1 Tax=Microbacterium sp. USTB-Y TaxID=2823692 RepID=UPI00203B1045|nr:sugar phosphate isomerase/epimerase family protein [Microbacterium sp. USTB-Y]
MRDDASANPLGVHMFVFTSQWDEENARRVFENAARAGYDNVEILIQDVERHDSELARRMSEEFELGVVSAVTGTIEADLGSSDAASVARGEARLVRAIRLSAEMGATAMGGPGFSAINRYAGPVSPEAWDRVIEVYSRVAEHARKEGVRVGLEPLNRYESNFINTLEQAAHVVRNAGPDALFVHADMFHMSMEEGSLPQAIEACADVIGYVHLSDSNRGPLGEGNVDWDAFFGALHRASYTGPITFESFSPQVLGSDWAGALAIWRDPWTDPLRVAADANAFIRRHLAAAAREV